MKNRETGQTPDQASQNELSESTKIGNALKLAIGEKTSSKDLETDWSKQLDAIKYLESSRLLDYLQIANMFYFEGTWNSNKTDAAILEVEELLRKTHQLKKDERYLFTPINRDLEQTFGIRTSTLPRDIFREAVLIMDKGRTSKQIEKNQRAESNLIIEASSQKKIFLGGGRLYL